MNEKIIKPGLIKRIVDLLKDKDQRFTSEDVENVMEAFWQIVIQAILNGDSINLNGYVLIETKHVAERKSRNVVENKEIILPEHYGVRFKAGSKLKNAAMQYTKRQLGVRHE